MLAHLYVRQEKYMSNDTIPKYYLNKIRQAKEQQLETLDLSNAKKTENKLLNFFGNVFSDRDKTLTNIPPEVFELKHIKTLNLSGNAINEIPESIENLSNLTHLDLSFNDSLIDLPESIGNLSNLDYLDLSFNGIRNLPESIGNLSNLTKLDLGFNDTRNLPESIGNLSKLVRLNLSFNQNLKNLPESIGNLFNLIHLNSRYNQLENLPNSIGNLSNLISLDLSNNHLKNLPESIGNLSNLIYLNLRSNKLETLPNSIANLSNATSIDLRINPFNNLKFLGGSSQQLIPCNCETCKSRPNPYTYKFNKLLEILAEHKSTITTINCGNYPYREVRVLGLINNAFNTNKELITNSSVDNLDEDQNITKIYNFQDIKQVAADIQGLLEQLEETYNTNTTLGKVAIAEEAIQRIDNDPELTSRILSVLQEGGTSALDSLLDHPAASFVIGALEDWQPTR